MDRYITSVSIAKWEIDQKFTIVDITEIYWYIVDTEIYYLWYCWNNYSLPSSLSHFFEWKTNTLQQTSKYWWKYLSKGDSNVSKVLLFGEDSFSNIKKYFCFNCGNWIYTFNKTFWCSLISYLTLTYFSLSSLVYLLSKIALSLMLFDLFCFVFLFFILTIAYFRYFVK